MVEGETRGAPVLTTDIVSPGPMDVENDPGSMKSNLAVTSDTKPKRPTNFGFVPLPKRLVYDPERPAHFGLLLNVVFGLSSTFTAANLYYCQPLLIEFSKSFDVTYGEVSIIPTLVQAGYATGILLISPLGDLVKRRPLLLILCTTSASLTVGLAVTRSLVVFQTLCFIIGATSVVPQILIPLSADLAPPSKRASAISIVLAGLLFGILIARVLAGIIAQYASWRVVYYTAIGVQCGVVVMLWATLPDYPAKNRDITYFEIIWTMARLAVTEPKLIQGCLICMGSSATYACFWVTLTFLLGGPPYHYSTLVIGLFGLVGICGVSIVPFTGRFIDRLVPWYASLISTVVLLATLGIYFGGAGINIAVVVIAIIGLDVGQQMQQVSVTTSVFGISQAIRARLNAVLILSVFIGQVMGTSVGTKLFVAHGWRASAGMMLGWTVWEIVALLARGPHCKRYTWFGYEGGIEWRKSAVEGYVPDVEKEKEVDQGAAVEASKDEKAGSSSPEV